MPINKTNRVEPPPPLAPPEVRRLSDIAILPTLWLWPGRVALGQLTLVAGQPGAGTSLLLMDLASRVSRGTPFPDANAGADGKNARSEASKGDTAAAAPADVLLILRRDQEQLAIPRLALMGADGGRIEVMGDVPDREMGKQEGSMLSWDRKRLDDQLLQEIDRVLRQQP
ncbi:MAG TPA: AAA family ATPase [Pirellulales bacterium]|nr:AAA family ATPase [Pirellulales bacterium]